MGKWVIACFDRMLSNLKSAAAFYQILKAVTVNSVSVKLIYIKLLD